jgi:hypothetical protein
MPDFWRHSGYALLDHTDAGKLLLSDDFLRAYLRRPEMIPPPEACGAERALHAALMQAPRTPVTPAEIAAIADPDARENYALLLRFFARLANAPSLEHAYLGLFLGPGDPVPPIFIDQVAQVILRHVLGDEPPPLRARAAELFYRPQRVSTQNGRILLADRETVEMHAATGGFGDLGRLIVEAQTPTRAIELDVLSAETATDYWGRDERHDTVLDLSFTAPGLDEFARLLEDWVRHFLDVAVSVQPVQRIRDERWVWHIGLDSESSAIMNDLYEGRDVDDARLGRVLSLFRLEFADPRLMLPRVAGRPVYLGLAMDKAGDLRLKPQNLLVNLPLAARA